MARSVVLEDRLTQGVIWKEMLRYFTPILMGTLLQQVYNLADTVIVGRFVGKEALAAVGGSAAAIVILMVHFFVAMGSGAGVITSQRYGAGDKDAVRRSIQNGIIFALISGAVLTVIGIAMSRPVLTLMRTTEDTMEYSVQYLRFYFLGMIPSMVYNMGSSILQALGDSKRPLLFLSVCAGLNIVLDLVFVIALGMEVVGVALATSLSQLVCAVMVLSTLLRLPREVRPDLRSLRVDWDIMKAMMRIGIPSGLQSIMYNLANAIIQVAINDLGTNSIAGWAAYRKIDELFWPVNNAIGLTVMTFVGQNFGARKMDRVKRCIRTGLIFHLTASVILSFVTCGLRYPLMELFAKGNPEVVECGAQVVLYTCVFFFTFAGTEVLSTTLRGLGNTFWPAMITLFGICISRVAYIYLVAYQNLSDFSIAMAYPMSWALTSVLFLIYYKFGNAIPEINKVRLQ